jgi:hypothetical protein
MLMAWQELDSGIQLDAPRLAVALVQSEAEMLHSPAHDVSSFVRADEGRWRLESFTERTFDAVDKIASSFDCVIIGFNAACHHGGIREALRAAQRPHSNLLILHQKEPEALDFLEDGLAIELEPLQTRAEEAHALERRERDELLLNWPRAVLAEGSAQKPIPCHASFSLRFSAATHWRTVLEVEDGDRRVPVMVRTSTTLNRRIVVCSAWLDPRDDEQHARLIENAIAYCAQGRPEIAVIAERGGGDARLPAAALLARKLRLQGASAVEIAPEPSAGLRFDRWPLCEVSHVVLRNGEQPEEYLRDGAEAREEVVSWLQSGGTLVGVNNGRFTLHTGLSDTHWVAQRWALWFHAVEEERWLDGVFRARAVLATLAKIQGPETRADPERLGLDRDLAELAPQLAGLLRRELAGRGHVNGLVSATAAALDIDRLAGRRVLADGERAAVESWLRDAFDQASLEEQFDIARALGEPARGLFEEAVAGASGSLSVVSVIRMREAAVACAAKGVPLSESRLRVDSLSELDSRPQLCAEFLAAMAGLALASRQQEVTGFDGTLVDRAVTTLAKHGVLARPDRRLPEVDAEAICSEALGLMSYFNMTGEATLPARPETVGLPTGAVEPVLKETRRARAKELEARSRMERLAKPLAMAQFVLLLEAIVLSLALAFLIVIVTSLNFDTLTLFGVAVASATTAFVLFALALVRAELYPTWGRAMAATVSQGIPGLKRRLAALTSDEEKRVP